MTKHPQPAAEMSVRDARLRADAMRSIDHLVGCCEEMRSQLRAFEKAITKSRGYIEQGGRASEIRRLADVAKVRAELTGSVANLERARHDSRLAMFRLQAFEGMSLSEIAREWGLSRQLVSRTLKESHRRRGRTVSLPARSSTTRGAERRDGLSRRR